MVLGPPATARPAASISRISTTASRCLCVHEVRTRTAEIDNGTDRVPCRRYLLRCGTQFLDQAATIFRTYRAGETETLSPEHPIALLGAKNEKSRDRITLVPQTRYIAEMPKMGA